MDKIIVSYEKEGDSAEIELQIVEAEDIQAARKELNDFARIRTDCIVEYSIIESDFLSAKITGNGISEAILGELEAAGWRWM
jgi:hypothetical protein